MKAGKVQLSSAGMQDSDYRPIPNELAMLVSEHQGMRSGSASVGPTSAQATGQPAMKAKPAKSLESWTALMPQEVRLLTLSALGQQRDKRLFAGDLASYACTSQAAADDVRNFHRIYRDAGASLLASRHLIRDAWELARTRMFFSRNDYFESLIRASASMYSAVVVDGRIDFKENSSFAGVANRALGLLLQGGIDYVHLRLGYPDIGVDSTSYAPDHESALEPIETLSRDSLERLRQGKPAPSAFLQITGVTPDQIARCLAKSAIRLNIAGMSLCSDDRHLQRELNTGSSRAGPQADVKMKKYPIFALTRDTWDALFSQLNDIRYLDLSGWGGTSLASPLADFLSRTAHLEKLHLSNCQFSEQDFRRMLTAIRQQGNLKFLSLEEIEPPLSIRSQTALAQLLEKLPKIRVSLGINQTAEVQQRFAGYWLESRIVFDNCPKVHRDLPEFEGAVDLLKPAI